MLDRDDAFASLPGSAELQQQLAKYQQALQLANKEATSLRSIVKTLEQTTGRLQTEKQQLGIDLAELRKQHAQLEEELRRSNELCSSQASTIRRLAVDHAAEMTEHMNWHHAEVAKLRAQLDRVSGQLIASAGPTVEGAPGVPKPLSWQHISKLSLHPIHVLRRVIAADQRREELGLQKLVPRLDDGPSRGVDADASERYDDIDLLLDEPADDTNRQSEDATMWLSICRRVHQVLQDRRRVHHLLGDEQPVDFLLRTRHVMVREWCAVHDDVVRLHRVILTLCKWIRYDLLPATVNRRLTSDLEKRLDAVVSSIDDIVSQFARVEHTCFSSVDQALHNINRGDAPTAAS